MKQSEKIGKTDKAISKIERYKWTMRDSQGDLVMIDKNSLSIHPSYQRVANEAKLQKIAQDWSWIACGAIIVANRGGEKWVVDGQHRVLAARKRADIEKLPCVIFNTEDVQEEAIGFLSSNTLRKPITGFDRFKAQIASNNKIAIKVYEILKKYGIELVKTASKPKQMKCIVWATKAAQVDLAGFESVMRVSSVLCENYIIHEKILDALFYIRKNNVDIEEKRIFDRLIKIGPERLHDGIKRASAYYKDGGAKVWAAGVITELNKGLHKKIEFNI